MTELRKCSSCKCEKLLDTYFSKNVKGLYKKTCIVCRSKYSCDKCDYKCSTNRNLQKHIKSVHDKIKDFECDKCDYKCSTNSDLQKHIKMVHDKIKDIECNKCDYKCSLNGDLQRHIKAVHDKIKDIECDKCDYKCSRTGNLREHIKIVHDKIKDFECKLCEYKCSTKYGLKRHIKICTGVDNCSAGEYKIKQALNEMRINYEFDSSHEVKSDKGYLRWDFIIQSDEPLFIEYDGRQHFGPVRFGSMSIEKAQKAFQKQKKYDKLKDDYCSDNGYLLLRIPYTEYGNINKLVGDFIIQNTDWGFE